MAELAIPLVALGALFIISNQDKKNTTTIEAHKKEKLKKISKFTLNKDQKDNKNSENSEEK